VNVTLSNPNGGPTLGSPSTGVLTIRNIHPPARGTLRFSAARYVVNESDGVALITVTRVGGSNGEVTVHYSASAGTALAGTEYTPVSGTLTFEDGETSKTFSVPILDDGIFRGNHTVRLRLDHPTGGAGLNHATAYVKILETDPIQHCTLQFDAASYDVNETAGTVTLTVLRTGDSDGTVQVNYVAFNGTAKAGINYGRTRGTLTFGPGVMSQTIEIPIFDNHKVQPTEKFHVVLFHPIGGAKLGTQHHAVVDVIDQDSMLKFTASAYSVNQSDGTATITVTRRGDLSQSATAHYSTIDGSAKAGVDYVAVDGDIVFDPGEASKTITITLLPGMHPPFQTTESFLLTLSDPGAQTGLDRPFRTKIVIHNR